MNVIVKLALVFFLLWLLASGLLLAFDHYIAGGLLLGSYAGLVTWTASRREA